MGKPKKGKKDHQEEDIDDITGDVERLAVHDVTAENGGDAAVKLRKKQKGKKKMKAQVSDSDGEGGGDEDKNVAAKVKGSGHSGQSKSAFNMLSMLGDEGDLMGDDDDENERDEFHENVKPKKSQDVVLLPMDDDIETISSSVPSKKKKKDKKKKNKGEDDDDLDAILADIEAPTERKGKKGKKVKQQVDYDVEDEVMDGIDGEVDKVEDGGDDKDKGDVEEGKKGKKKKKQDEMTAADLTAMIEGKEGETVLTLEDLENQYDDKSSKRKKKKKGKADEIKEEDGEEKEEKAEEGEEPMIKTAAQKKKEKKEREKEKKEKERKKKDKKSTPDDSNKTDETEQEGKITADITESSADKMDEEAAVTETEAPTKKKKKGKKEDKEKEKKPKNKQIAAIREHLRMLQEEEQRLIREADEKAAREEEAIEKREEEKRLAEEKKQLKKQREKEKVDRQKREGTYMTAKQKAEKRRAEQMLEVMRAQGMAIPDRDNVAKKKPPVYSSRRRNKPQTPTDETKKLTDETPQSEPAKPLGDVVMETKEDEGGAEEGDDVKDVWDESEDEELEHEAPVTSAPPPQPEVKQEQKKAAPVKQTSEETESESESSSEESDSDGESSSSSEDDQAPLERARLKIQRCHEEAEKNRSVDVLRAPVICVLGHVDTGKTKILDKLRRTNVQEGEAGGITQQIGATNVPGDAIIEKTQMCKEFREGVFKLPGMLIIDTPGHESFSNLRTRGSSLCDIAVLVVDIMHGLEPQTIESINLLRKGKTPFVVALNKVDRLYQWESNPGADVQDVIKEQKPHTKLEFDSRVRETVVQFAEQKLNVVLAYENKDPRQYISMVPTSAHSGDGMGNLLALICQLSQTMLAKRLSYSQELQATVMEVKTLPGLGTTIDVIVVNGIVREGNTIVIAGTDGPIVSQVRGLLLPRPMKELRVKTQYEHCKELKAAQGVKIIGKDFEKAVAGLPFYVAHDEDEVLFYKEELLRALEDVLGAIKLSDRGVFVQASTIGSLEALLEFLKTSKIPYAGINIGPVHKKDVMKASVMLEHDTQYAVILAFDVKIEREAQEMADGQGVRIFAADIIYHLFDRFMEFRDELKKGKQEEFRHVAVFPSKIRILPQFIFNSRDPIVAGVQIEAGTLKVGTPICVPSKEFLDLGRVSGIEYNHKSVDSARKGQEVCIKIESSSNDAPKMFGRHFDETDMLVSKISRQSIDVMKEWFRDELHKSDWQLMVELKKTFDII